ncbi:hypothetical protein HELRODRAFT_171690 [Helobdella robusta]|uniref:Uncharacterized protein n=1 Tax=Helobdella robusta TaxID=6412 RepID=T1F4K1_HELRO|nr:hypothetical protein HELRODRAFT_171690 [Helobdella robusta]ESO05321.1 hypothetical protein HELRODRAFT_171690 [Helobdella robusta]
MGKINCLFELKQNSSIDDIFHSFNSEVDKCSDDCCLDSSSLLLKRLWKEQDGPQIGQTNNLIDNIHKHQHFSCSSDVFSIENSSFPSSSSVMDNPWILPASNFCTDGSLSPGAKSDHNSTSYGSLQHNSCLSDLLQMSSKYEAVKFDEGEEWELNDQQTSFDFNKIKPNNSNAKSSSKYRLLSKSSCREDLTSHDAGYYSPFSTGVNLYAFNSEEEDDVRKNLNYKPFLSPTDSQLSWEQQNNFNSNNNNNLRNKNNGTDGRMAKTKINIMNSLKGFDDDNISEIGGNIGGNVRNSNVFTFEHNSSGYEYTSHNEEDDKDVKMASDKRVNEDFNNEDIFCKNFIEHMLDNFDDLNEDDMSNDTIDPWMNKYDNHLFQPVSGVLSSQQASFKNNHSNPLPISKLKISNSDASANKFNLADFNSMDQRLKHIMDAYLAESMRMQGNYMSKEGVPNSDTIFGDGMNNIKNSKMNVSHGLMNHSQLLTDFNMWPPSLKQQYLENVIQEYEKVKQFSPTVDGNFNKINLQNNVSPGTTNNIFPSNLFPGQASNIYDNVYNRGTTTNSNAQNSIYQNKQSNNKNVMFGNLPPPMNHNLLLSKMRHASPSYISNASAKMLNNTAFPHYNSYKWQCKPNSQMQQQQPQQQQLHHSLFTNQPNNISYNANNSANLFMKTSNYMMGSPVNNNFILNPGFCSMPQNNLRPIKYAVRV